MIKPEEFIDTLSITERTKYDTYTKAQVYEAYVSETIARKQLENQIKAMGRQLAEARFVLRTD